jgi:hypothetical protein
MWTSWRLAHRSDGSPRPRGESTPRTCHSGKSWQHHQPCRQGPRHENDGTESPPPLQTNERLRHVPAPAPQPPATPRGTTLPHAIHSTAAHDIQSPRLHRWRDHHASSHHTIHSTLHTHFQAPPSTPPPQHISQQKHRPPYTRTPCHIVPAQAAPAQMPREPKGSNKGGRGRECSEQTNHYLLSTAHGDTEKEMGRGRKGREQGALATK